jgi:biopolymer transport protein ExbD
MQVKAGLEPDPEPLVDINTTPLVDVLLVLLVMLIITIPVQLHTANIEMPGAATPPSTPPIVVRLDVTPAGRYLWNGEPVADRTDLEQRLAEAARQPEQPEIHLRPNRSGWGWSRWGWWGRSSSRSDPVTHVRFVGWR